MTRNFASAYIRTSAYGNRTRSAYVARVSYAVLSGCYLR